MTAPVVPSLRLHRRAAVDALRAATSLPGDSETRVGSGTPPAPPVGQAQPVTPYVIVYGLNGPTTGPADGEHSNADMQFVVQATCVGSTDDEADGMADAVAAVWLDPASWSIPGRDVSQPSLDMNRGAARDDTLSPPRFAAQIIVRVPTSPA